MIRNFLTIFVAVVNTVFMLLSAASNAAGAVLINEVAWMGTVANSADEWVELSNSSAGAVDLTGWGLYEAGGSTLIITLSGSIAAGGYYLVERTDDNSISNITADIFGPFAGSGLNNSGENLVLKDSLGAVVDSVDATAGWPAGDNSAKSSMERKSDGTWQTNDGATINGKDTTGGNIIGTPKAVNSGSSSSTSTPSVSQVVSSGGGGGSGNVSTPLLPVLKAEAGGDVVIEAGQPIAFNGTTSQGATTYKWYLGDGTVKNGVDITYTYQFPGTYLVTLEVGNSTDTAVDQSRVFVFGGKGLINEIFVGDTPAVGGWIEIYNPNEVSADLSGWILESGEKKFTVPNFVLVPSKSFLVLAQSVTGLDLISQGKISLRYPNGLAIDEVIFEKPESGFSASRTTSGFFWTKELTPGRANIVTSSGASLLEQVNVVPKKVAWKTESAKASNYIASFYSAVSARPTPDQSIPPVALAQAGFWTNLFSGLSFWVVLIVVVGLFVSIFYIKLTKANANNTKSH